MLAWEYVGCMVGMVLSSEGSGREVVTVSSYPAFLELVASQTPVSPVCLVRGYW